MVIVTNDNKGSTLDFSWCNGTVLYPKKLANLKFTKCLDCILLIFLGLGYAFLVFFKALTCSHSFDIYHTINMNCYSFLNYVISSFSFLCLIFTCYIFICPSNSNSHHFFPVTFSSSPIPATHSIRYYVSFSKMQSIATPDLLN